MILHGHPTGSPFSHHAALAHLEAGVLDGFCVPWMPTGMELALLGHVPGLAGYTQRLGRRRFPPLAGARLVEGRLPEWGRMVRRVAFGGRFASEGLSYEANDWLMRTMARESGRGSVTAVHSYEDCAQWTFEAAGRLGKACVYDLPIGYYPAWERKQEELARTFTEWLPPGGLSHSKYVRPAQKKREMELADLVLVPCSFVRETIREYIDKDVCIAPYAVDAGFWVPNSKVARDGPLRFIYSGQCSLRKGVPVLLDAWRRANVGDSTLDLVGGWHLAEGQLRQLPPSVTVHGPVSSVALRAFYQQSDVLVFPSFFEGFGLVILEAMACGLPVITTGSTAGPDILTQDCGRLLAAGDVESLVESLRWFASHRERLPDMSLAARKIAESRTWANYRRTVTQAVARFAR